MSVLLAPDVARDRRELDPRSGVVEVLVLHARAVPSATREAFAESLGDVGTHPACVVVRTCQRVELYVARDCLGDVQIPEPPAGTVQLEGAAAARHLISVAAGLESAVLGEDQVLHQLRQCYTARRSAAPLDARLDRLFRVALQAGRQAREQFGGERRSLGDVAAEQVAHHVGPLAGRTLLVVGAGSMGRLAAVAASRHGADVLVTNRTAARASALAADVGGTALPWGDDLPVAGLSGVVVAISGSWTLTPEHVDRLAALRTPVVDLSSPPAVPAELRAVLGDRLMSIDDLAWGSPAQLREGLRDKLETLVSDTGREYCRWLRAREAQPALQGMTEAVEKRRTTEMEWLLRRLPDLTPEQQALIEQMTHRLVGGILHHPRSALNLDETGDLERAARELFGV
jgi:glutamyl-tRNA reductase